MFANNTNRQRSDALADFFKKTGIPPATQARVAVVEWVHMHDGIGKLVAVEDLDRMAKLIILYRKDGHGEDGPFARSLLDWYGGARKRPPINNRPIMWTYMEKLLGSTAGDYIMDGAVVTDGIPWPSHGRPNLRAVR